MINNQLNELMNRTGVGSYNEKIAACKVLVELDLVSLESKQTRLRRPYFEYSSTELFDKLMSGDCGAEECECECECECGCECARCLGEGE